MKLRRLLCRGVALAGSLNDDHIGRGRCRAVGLCGFHQPRAGGGVYAVGSASICGDAVVYSGLPLTDYPLVLTDRGSLDLR